MKPNHFKLGLALAVCVGQVSFASDCSASSKEVDFTHGEATVLVSSPDHRWVFVSKGSVTWEHSAGLVILNYKTKKRWNIGSLGRNGTVFWSDDSKRLILRDEYAADDTRLRVFDLTDSGPQELHGLDRSIKKDVASHTPQTEGSLWITYPQVCFSGENSSLILLTVDAPHAPKSGGSGKSLRLRLIVDLTTQMVREYDDRQK
jgi:hypothetical protein